MGDELLLPVYDEWRWQVGIARLDVSRHGTDWRFDDLAIGAASGVLMIQGTLAEVAPGRVHMLMRTKVGRVWQVESWMEAGPGKDCGRRRCVTRTPGST